MRLQRDRLGLAEWLRSAASESLTNEEDPLVAISAAGRGRLETLCNALAAIETQLRSHPSFSDTLDKEALRQRAATEVLLGRLNEIRREVATLEHESDAAKTVANRFDRTERFIGRLEQALRTYDRTDPSSDLREEISDLRNQIEALQRIISEAEIRRKLQNALDRIQAIASRCIPKLDAEWPEAPIRLIVEELTVKVLRGNRDDYLWEIGSGANWLAYHVATTIALQHFFLGEPHHPVPAMLVFDQPSQVYFPKRAAHPDETEESQLRNEDVLAVRKVFSLLGEEVQSAKGRLQVIVLDHAGEDVWGNLPDVQLIEEWRGRALVPFEWL
jgi:polyhydroxyalkanoate synthesis regulator phasin